MKKYDQILKAHSSWKVTLKQVSRALKQKNSEVEYRVRTIL